MKRKVLHKYIVIVPLEIQGIKNTNSINSQYIWPPTYHALFYILMNSKPAAVKVTRQQEGTLIFVLCSILITSQGGVLPAQVTYNMW